MKIIDHGEWNTYNPTRKIMDAPPGSLFIRRKSDKKDWYEYVASNPFKEDTIKINCRLQVMGAKLEKGWVAAACTRDATMLFPIQSIVLELEDVNSKDPQKDFQGKIYDPETKTFSEKRAFE